MPQGRVATGPGVRHARAISPMPFCPLEIGLTSSPRVGAWRREGDRICQKALQIVTSSEIAGRSTNRRKSGNEQTIPHARGCGADLSKIVYPILGFPKIDGIRAVIHNGQALSRKLLPLPNRYIQEFFEDPGFQGWTVSSWWANQRPAVHQAQHQRVMSHSGTPTFTYCVFDHWEHSAGTARLTLAEKAVKRMGRSSADPQSRGCWGTNNSCSSMRAGSWSLGTRGSSCAAHTARPKARPQHRARVAC